MTRGGVNLEYGGGGGGFISETRSRPNFTESASQAARGERLQGYSYSIFIKTQTALQFKVSSLKTFINEKCIL